MSLDLSVPFSRPIPADEPIALALRQYPPGVLDWSDLEDGIADAISDSLDVDWTSRDGARAVVAYLKALSTPSSPTQVMDRDTGGGGE